MYNDFFGFCIYGMMSRTDMKINTEEQLTYNIVIYQ